MIDTMKIKQELGEEIFAELFEDLKPYKNNGKRYVTTKFARYGFPEIAFNKTKYGRNLAVKFQPIRLLRTNEFVELCRFENYLAVESAFNEFWRDIIGSETLPEFMWFENWKISRIDYAFQFRMPYLQTYLNLLQRGRVEKYFTEHEYATGVYATANTVNLNFYDKQTQLQSKSYLKASDIESAKNLLRLEVQCKSDYLQKLKRKFKLDSTSVRDFWDANIAEHILRYRIKMLVGAQDFYRLDAAERKLKLQGGNNAFILCSLLRDIAQVQNAQSAKENFCRKHSGISPDKYKKLLHKLRKKFRINSLTFPADENLPTG